MENCGRRNGRTIRTGFGVVLALALCLCAATSVKASDIQIFPTGAVFTIGNLTWGTSGANGFNNNFYFSPLSLTGSICVYIKNNNTTNAHGFSATIAYTGNPSSQSPSDGTWNNYAAPAPLTSPVSPSPSSTMGATISGAALISINFSGSATLGGSPETASVFLVQTSNTTSCTLAGGRQIQTVTVLLGASTANSTMFAPASTNKFRLLGYCIDIPFNAAMAAQGIQIVDLLDGNTVILNREMVLPAVAGGTGPELFSSCMSLGDGIVSSVYGNPLNVNIGTILTSGNIFVMAWITQQ